MKIQLELELTKHCNLKCPYCCASSNTKIKDLRTDLEKYNLYRRVLETLNEKPHDYEVRLMGGEPTLFSFFNDLVKFTNTLSDRFSLNVFTNGTKKIYGKFNVTTSFHTKYHNLSYKILKNLELVEGNKILNFLIDNDIWKRILERDSEILNYIKLFKKDFFVHPQFIFQLNDKRENILKCLDIFRDLGVQEYFENICNYRENLNKFFSNKSLVCCTNCFQIQEDGTLHNDCEGKGLSINLFENFDISCIKPSKTICKKRECFYDNCAYNFN